MKVLMFGWEFPPHISGGLGTACYGITKALSANPSIGLTFVVPRAWGDEPGGNVEIIGANKVNLAESNIRTERFKAPFTCLSVRSAMVPYVDPEQFKQKTITNEGEALARTADVRESVKFSGGYTPDLMTEIHNFSVVAEYLAGKENYDVIHAHDWLTFPAGILAKQKTGKPLVVHVHATDYDRSGGRANPEVYAVEKAGMDAADTILTVSDHTREMVCKNYHIDPSKVITVHNGVEPFPDLKLRYTPGGNRKKIVTFLGRITIQKGPRYFVETAQKVLSRLRNVEFVMAGSGDLTLSMMDMVRQMGLVRHFSFPGFLKGGQVTQMFCRSDIFIMPSVSEPFGICPLEAMSCHVPVIISRQSGVSEVIRHAVKVDYWDTDAMADAVFSLIKRPALRRLLGNKGAAEVKKIGWESAAEKIAKVYSQFLRA